MAGKGLYLLTNYVRPFHNSLSISYRGFKRYVKSTAIAIKERQKKYYESLTKEEYNELFRRSNFIEWNYSAEVYAFGKRLSEEFHPELLVQAFTHRSYITKEELNLKDSGVADLKINLKDNEDLALKGEKIISNYVSRYVSYFFPRFPLEGIHTIQDYLTGEEVLANISKNLGTTFLILSGDYPVESETYSKTLKAIIGALHECQGIERTNLFVRDFIVTQLAGKDINDFLNISNSLSVLSDILKRDGKEAPEPRIVCQSGINTVFANYHVAVYSDKQFLGQCSGESIDVAVEMAAFNALKRLFHTTDSCSPITFDIEKIPDTVKNLKLSEWRSTAFKNH